MLGVLLRPFTTTHLMHIAHAVQLRLERSVIRDAVERATAASRAGSQALLASDELVEAGLICLCQRAREHGD